MSVTYVLALAGELERLARDSADRTAEAYALTVAAVPAWAADPDGLTRTWDDYCDLVMVRDLIEPPGAEHWRELCGPDYAAGQFDAWERKAAEADEALDVLLNGRRAA